MFSFDFCYGLVYLILVVYILVCHKLVLNIPCWHGSGGKLPFDDASVGSVLAVIKKVENLGDLFITEISRVLKAGGMVLIQSSPSDQDVCTVLPIYFIL